MKKNNTVLPRVVTFRPDYPHAVRAVRIAEAALETNSELIGAHSWDELSSSIAKDPELLLFHANIAKTFSISLEEFVKMVQSLIACTPTCRKDVKLGALISKDTTQEDITRLKLLNIDGILPTNLDYGREARANAQIEILKGNKFWPEDIIKNLPNQVNTKKTILFYQPDRYTARHDSLAADKYFEEHIPCNFLTATTWDDFVVKLNYNLDLVGFHSDLFNNEQLSTQFLIKTIETTLALKNKKPDIFITVNKKTTRDVIDMLRKTNIIGLQFGRGCFGLEYAAESYRRLLEDRTHWPEDVISTLLEYQENKKPLHIYFRDDMDSYMTPEVIEKSIKDTNVILRVCKNWSDLSVALHDMPKNIVFHIDMVRRHGGTISEFMMMLETMMKYANVPIKPNIGVGIEADTHLSTIKELQKHKILAIVPSARTLGTEYTNAAIKSMSANEPYWPKDIINKLPGNEHKIKNKNSTALTLRQQEVFDLIANRGLSNKQIARVLNISESTVKIHVSAVMKNLCVRNRTQLALTK
jgi:DNA-binding NarL/FixJ family response regulator